MFQQPASWPSAGGALVALALASASCATDPLRAVAGTTAVYRCADGYRFVVRFEPQRLWLFLPDEATSIPQVPAASGLHYTNRRITFRGRDEEARLEIDGSAHVDCVNLRAEVPWEEARLRGVDFRAVGQEPGWSLEIDETRSIVFSTAHDSSRHVFPAAKPKVDPDTSTATYESDTAGSHPPGRRIRVAVEARECRDTMSGETFPASVTVSIDGQTYTGCGRALQ